VVSRCCGSGSAFCVVGVDVTHMPRRQIEPNQATPAMMSLRSSGLWVVYGSPGWAQEVAPDPRCRCCPVEPERGYRSVINAT
jgi:hypothetical protein